MHQKTKNIFLCKSINATHFYKEDKTFLYQKSQEFLTCSKQNPIVLNTWVLHRKKFIVHLVGKYSFGTSTINCKGVTFFLNKSKWPVSINLKKLIMWDISKVNGGFQDFWTLRYEVAQFCNFWRNVNFSNFETDPSFL